MNQGPLAEQRSYDVQLLPDWLRRGIEGEVEKHLLKDQEASLTQGRGLRLEQTLRDVGTQKISEKDAVAILRSLHEQGELAELLHDIDAHRALSGVNLSVVGRVLDHIRDRLFINYLVVKIGLTSSEQHNHSPFFTYAAGVPRSQFVEISKELLRQLHVRQKTGNYLPPGDSGANLGEALRLCAASHGRDRVFVFEEILVPVAEEFLWKIDRWMPSVLKGIIKSRNDLPDDERARFTEALWKDLRILQSSLISWSVLPSLDINMTQQIAQHALDTRLTDRLRANALLILIQFPQFVDFMALSPLVEEMGPEFTQARLYLISDPSFLQFNRQPALDAVLALLEYEDPRNMIEHVRILAGRPPLRNDTTCPERIELFREAFRMRGFSWTTLDNLNNQQSNDTFSVAKYLFGYLGATAVLAWACEVNEPILNKNAHDLIRISIRSSSSRGTVLRWAMAEVLEGRSDVRSALIVAADARE